MPPSPAGQPHDLRDLVALLGLVDDASLLAEASEQAAQAGPERPNGPDDPDHPDGSSGAEGALLLPEHLVGAGLDAVLADRGVEAGRRVDLVLSGGAGALRPSVEWLVGSGLPGSLGTVHVRLREGAGPGEAVHNARRVVAAADDLATVAGAEDVVVRVTPPRLDGPPSAPWLEALDEIAASSLELGWWLVEPTSGARLPAPEVAALLDAALDRELSLSAVTAPTEVENGPDGYGVLGVLLAVRSALDGEGDDGVRAALSRPDVAAAVASLDPAALASARRWAGSFGSLDPARTRQHLVRASSRNGPDTPG